MGNAQEVVSRFEGDNYELAGDVVFPFWEGQELETIITLDGHRSSVSHQQLLLLEKMLRYPRNIRPEIEKQLFDYYQQEIYMSVMEVGHDDEELTPTLTSPKQIWELLGEPAVRIRHISDDEPIDDCVRFRLSFYGCPWDEEHGFGIQVTDWEITEFGGEIA